MKTRIIHTKIWDDEYFSGLSIVQKGIFIYYLTNSRVGLTGIYEVTDRIAQFETGSTTQQLRDAKEEFQKSGKILFFGTWIKIVNSEKYNAYSGPKQQVAYEKELSSIPSSVLEGFSNIRYPIDTVSVNEDRVSIPLEIINKKSEIRNQNRDESVREGGKRKSLEDLTTTDLDEIAEIYHVPRSFVDSKLDDMSNWLTSKGKTYRDYKAALRDWVKRDAMSIQKEAHGQSKIAYINTEDTGGINDQIPDQTDQRLRLSDSEAYTGQHFEGIGGGG